MKTAGKRGRFRGRAAGSHRLRTQEVSVADTAPATQEIVRGRKLAPSRVNPDDDFMFIEHHDRDRERVEGKPQTAV